MYSVCLLPGVAGYISGVQYKLFGGTNWVRNVLLTATLFCGPLLVVFSFLNTVAIVYRVRCRESSLILTLPHIDRAQTWKALPVGMLVSLDTHPFTEHSRKAYLLTAIAMCSSLQLAHVAHLYSL